MKGLLLLLYCIQLMVAQLYGNHTNNDIETTQVSVSENSSTPEASTSMANKTSTVTHYYNTRNTSSISPTTTQPISQTTQKPWSAFFRYECHVVYVVAGGLILACIILLPSVLLLACKVCQLNRRLKTLSSNSDLISNCQYRMQTVKENANMSEPEVIETSILMADIDQTQEDAGNGTTKEEEAKVNEDGQMGETTKKDAEGTANREEASTGEKEKETPPIVAEDSSSSQPQEDTTNCTSTSAVAASSSQGTEEPKDVV